MNTFKGYFNLKYIDDNHKTHLTIAKNKAELEFYMDRFYVIEYELVSA